MAQTAVPISDVSYTGWTPPAGESNLYLQLQIGPPTYKNDPTPDSVIVPPGGTFICKFAPLSAPGPGPITMTVRLSSTDPASLVATVALLQGNSVIGDMKVSPPEAFANFDLTLSTA